MIWYKNNDSDIVISTRIRLARNLADTPFPAALKDKAAVAKKIRESITEGNSTLAGEFEYYDMAKLSPTQKQALAEEHLISLEMLKGDDKSALISKDKTMSIMIMEEDHIRLQIILGGMQLDKAWDIAGKVDDVMSESLGFAFDEKLGYLTACPTNLGTGMRASVMMHLPALTATQNMSKVISSAQSIGITVRGLYGEGSKSYGNLYQISNRITTGASEEEIISKLKDIANQLTELEKKARDSLASESKTELSDKLYRSYGILKYARSISSAEAKALLSDVLLGQNMGIITEKGKISPIECMVITEPALIAGSGAKTPEERDIKRAELIRAGI